MDPTGYSSNRKENRSGIKYEFIVLYDPNEWRKKEEKLEKDFKKSDSILEKACILGQYSALSWKKRYNFVKKQYQVMVNDIAPGLISPEQSGMAFYAALFELGGGAVGGAIKGLKGIKTVKLGSGIGM